MDKLEKLIAKARRIHTTGLIMHLKDGAKRRIDAGDAIRMIFDGADDVARIEDPEPDTRTNGRIADLLNGILEA